MRNFRNDRSGLGFTRKELEQLQNERDLELLRRMDPEGLISAAKNGRKEIVMEYLSRGVDINFVLGAERALMGTALAGAVYSRSRELVTTLLDQGAKINLVGGRNGTALITAAIRDQGEMVPLLVQRGAAIDLVAGEWGTALAAAAFHGHSSTVKFLLEQKANVNVVGGSYGTALSCAVAGSPHTPERDHIVKLLLDHGAEGNQVNEFHGTALCIATDTDYSVAVRLLLERGARPVVNWMFPGPALKYSACGTAVSIASHKGRPDIIQLLLDAGANLNLVGPGQRTALMAAVVGHGDPLATLDMLLKRGADVNMVVDHEAGTVLAQAALVGKKHTVRFLLGRGAQIDLAGGNYGSALAAAAYQGHQDTMELLLERGADINYMAPESHYGTALTAAASNFDINNKNYDSVRFLLDHGANVNMAGGVYGTALAAATYSGNDKIVNLLLDQGADINKIVTVGTKFGTTALAAGICGTSNVTSLPRIVQPDRASYITDPTVKILLNRGANINLVVDEYGTLLGKAAYEGNTGLVTFLLQHGADIFHVGGCKYSNEKFGYPTALDAAKAGNVASEELLTLLSETMANHQMKDIAGDQWSQWPPFPMPTSTVETIVAADHDYNIEHAVHRVLETILDPEGTANTWLTVEQADLPCWVLDRAQVISNILKALVGIHPNAAKRNNWFIHHDIQYFLSQGYDLGLAYAAARVGWKDFNNLDERSIAVQRYIWLRRASGYYRERGEAICNDEKSKNEIIKSPYLVMPRRIWDIRANRVVDYGMVHSDFCVRREEATEYSSSPVTQAPFWAITHSWTNNMESVKTTINGSQWPVPLPSGLNLENDLRTELLNLGADYIWLDVLCLRQGSSAQHYPDFIERNRIKAEEWKLDVPTIGNIYRSAAAVVRYFNGLGMPFSDAGWENPRHWLQRAWTLQEIKNENITFNGGVYSQISSSRLMNTLGKVPGRSGWQLREALRPILALAAEVDSSHGCSVYELAREMARRYATQPTDKVSGLLYLLRTINLPTYSVTVSDEDAWTRCFPVLPFGRKMELLFDFPYRAGLRYPSFSNPKEQSIARDWLPILPWGQLLRWSTRTSHHATDWCESCRSVMNEPRGSWLQNWRWLIGWPLTGNAIPNFQDNRVCCKNCGSSAESDDRWFPTWTQLMKWPTRNPRYRHTLPASPQAQPGESLEIPPGINCHHTSFFLTNIWSISQAPLRAGDEPGEYEIEVSGKVIGFYCPYQNQAPIYIQNVSQKFTLATPQPEVSGNWALCEVIETREWERDPRTELNAKRSKVIKYEVLRKVGVLRTDSCSVLFVGAETGNNVFLKKINALFI